MSTESWQESGGESVSTGEKHAGQWHVANGRARVPTQKANSPVTG
jgi:hypothetical protein